MTPALLLLAALAAAPTRAQTPAATVPPAPAAPTVGVPTPIEDPGHVGLGRWHAALAAAGRGEGVARALHYGDSTLGNDGIARTVRARLTARFGDAGPGFLSGGLDPRWLQRADVASSRGGAWSTLSLLLGGAGGRYGLGGIVGVMRAGAWSRVHAVDAAGNPVPQRHLEVWYQAGQGYGSLKVAVDGGEARVEAASAPATEDRRLVIDRPEGFTELALSATGGSVPLYGVVLETGQPGATWETLAVIGVGSKSFTTYAGPQLAEQQRLRDPDLVVVMLGGNEAGFPILSVQGGAGYVPIYQGALDLILAGAGDAGCLVVSPLDQGFVDEAGVAKSRPGMANQVARQREVALARGCAFWSAWDAMGGKGAALAWANRRGLGLGDYVHLTSRGLEHIGNLLADALLADHEAWAAGR